MNSIVDIVLAIIFGSLFMIFLAYLTYKLVLSILDSDINTRWDEEENVESQEHPNHYNHCKIECIDYIQEVLTEEEYRGFLKGNVIKYLHRERFKGGSMDIGKAKVYLDWLDNLEN